MLINRIDKETSGILATSGDETVRGEYERLFRRYEITKAYLTIGNGYLKKNSKGMLINHLKEAKKSSNGFYVRVEHAKSSSSRLAITAYINLFTKHNYHLLLCFPITGRTHQIRVQLANADCSIIGDSKYSKCFQDLCHPNRTMLHSLLFGTHDYMVYCDIPDDFKYVVKALFPEVGYDYNSYIFNALSHENLKWYEDQKKELLVKYNMIRTKA